MNRVDYFYDGDRFVASLDRGSSGMFRLITETPEKRYWDFIVPGSLYWDSYHQDLYCTHHDFDPCPKEISDTLPPLPEVPEFKRMSWKDNFLPLKPLSASDFPKIAERIENSGEKEAFFWFTLKEDLYETYMGDGTFLYFSDNVFETEQQALDFAEPKNRESERAHKEDHVYGIRYTVKKFSVVLIGGSLTPIGWEPDMYEHYKVEEIIGKIEEMLG